MSPQEKDCILPEERQKSEIKPTGVLELINSVTDPEEIACSNAWATKECEAYTKQLMNGQISVVRLNRINVHTEICGECEKSLLTGDTAIVQTKPEGIEVVFDMGGWQQIYTKVDPSSIIRQFAMDYTIYHFLLEHRKFEGVVYNNLSRLKSRSVTVDPNELLSFFQAIKSPTRNGDERKVFGDRIINTENPKPKS